MFTSRILFSILCFIIASSSWLPSGNLLTSQFVKSNKANELIALATKELVVREEGCENCGLRIKEYLNYSGVNIPAPWCAAFVSFIFKEADFKSPKTAWSPSLFPTNRITKVPNPGCVLGIYSLSLKRIAHCGIVKMVKGDLIYSIEGNTNIGGEREGDGVYSKVRSKHTVSVYADWLKGGAK